MSIKSIRKTSKQDAINILYPAFSPENKESRKYYDKCHKVELNNFVDNQELVKKLWNVSEQLLKDYGISI